MKSTDQKRKEANQRAADRANRTTAQQLKLIASRRGESKKEIARLTAK